MYAHARASNILKSVKDESKNLDSVELSDLNREILLKCLDYPNVIISSANNFSPSILAEYLYDLAKLFSQMYETEKVLEAKGVEKTIRVLIVKFVKRILNDGLLLLRIKPLEQM
jgi:arginyl-tRNA synthetase